MINVFTQREQLVTAIRTGEGLRPLVARLAVGSLLCALLYGAVLGAQMGGWQLLASPVKLPLILLGTGGLCGGALYVMLALAGARLHWAQVAGLALSAIAASSLTMAALLPVTAFWTLSVQQQPGTLSVTLIHSVAFVLAGATGARFGREITDALFPERRIRMTVVVWMWIYGLVGQQMAWIFRPHFHATQTFMVPLASGGSALEMWAQELLRWLRL
jgi:hypothetical protein